MASHFQESTQTNRNNDPGFYDIGRPIDPDWHTDFIEKFFQITQGQGFELEPQIQPGVLYLDDTEARSAAHRKATLLFGARNSAQEIEILKKRGLFHPKLALTKIPVTVRGLDLKKASHNYRVRVALGDLSPEGSDEHIVEKEYRLARRAARLMINPQHGDKVEPRHRVSLGLVVPNRYRLTNDIVREVFRLLDPEVELGPIGKIRTE